ncbi:MAG TPA: hypothetical protein VNO14_00140 [Blastocatellia bacterium]|nr:hypothetical protein [Blastocatellia bacterium]
MKKLLNNWTKLVFIFLPLCIVAVDAAIIIKEHLDPETEKAIRLVRESTSRKENFTVQQYLYMTVYHRKSRGEAIEIRGWRAAQKAGPATDVTVEFSFSDKGVEQTAVWEVNLAEKRVTPKNDLARNLSWH